MPASIRVTLYDSPGGTQVGSVTTDSSRDDLRKGYQVVCESVYESNSYSWALAFTPDSSGPVSASGNNFDGTPSLAALLPPEGSTSRTCKFNIDWDGAYLLRLVVDAGLPTEATTFIRLRLMTTFGDIKLVAAGERRDQTGVVPVDASPEGWANDQNQNLQRIMGLVRRTSTSGRVLYVDANRGRDRSADPNDPDNIIRMPGPDSVARDQSGFRIRAVGFGDFSSINDAIAYAEGAVGRGEPAPSELDPYWIMVAPGYYEEALDLKPWIHLAARDAGLASLMLLATELFRVGSVTVRVPSGSAQGMHLATGGMTTPASAFEYCAINGIQLESAEANTYPALGLDGIVAFTALSSATKLGTQGCGIGVRPGSLGGFIAFDSAFNGTQDSFSYSGAALEDGCLGILVRSTATGGSGYIAEGADATSFLLYSILEGYHASGWGARVQGDLGLTFTHSFGGASGGALRYECPTGSTQSFEPTLAHSSLDGDVVFDGSNTTGTITVYARGTTAKASGDVTSIGGNVTIQGGYFIGGGGGGGGNVWDVHPLASATPYQMTNDNRLVLADTTLVSPTVHMPLSPSEGQIASVKDAGGNAAVNNITLTTGGGGNVFDASLGGGGAYTMAVNNSAFNLCYYSGVWYSV
jgi:hypothetical protein